MAGRATWSVHNATWLSRVYPGAARVDSSNYEPLPFWEWDRLADSTARRDYVERRLSEVAAVAGEEPAIQ